MNGFPITLAMTESQRGPDTSEMRHGRTTSARVRLDVKPTDIRQGGKMMDESNKKRKTGQKQQRSGLEAIHSSGDICVQSPFQTYINIWKKMFNTSRQKYRLSRNAI